MYCVAIIFNQISQKAHIRAIVGSGENKQRRSWYEGDTTEKLEAFIAQHARAPRTASFTGCYLARISETYRSMIGERALLR